MARRKIREYDGKRILTEYLKKYSNNTINTSFLAVLITPKTNLNDLAKQHPWLNTTKLVCKPDQLFGKRKKYNLVLTNATLNQVKEFLKKYQHKEITIGKASDKLTHFIIDPFIPHQQEYYVSITSQREIDTILFSTQGGVDIEDRWNTVTTITIPVLEKAQPKQIQQKIPQNITKEKREVIISLLKTLHTTYLELNFSSLEINPFTIDHNNKVHILDLVAEIDDCAHFKNEQSWGNLPLPAPFGKKISPEEEFIQTLDENSGASLKLTVLNLYGRLWNILSGGGASIIYLDSLVNAGLDKEIANYGEYSGNPTTEESYQYAKTILKLLTQKIHPKGKVLLIAGAIANFTDIEKTFIGIIRALKEYQQELQKGKISIIVRRGGPNDQKALQLMKQAGKELNLSIEVFGPETPMTSIVPLVVQKLK